MIGIGQLVHPASSDGFRTLARQSYQTLGDWPNGVRYQYEAAREALLGGLYRAHVGVVRACGLDAIQGKWPEPFFLTRLAADTGASYTSITLADRPLLREILHLNAAAPVLAIVVVVRGEAGA